jgi:hypothetical protein
MNTLMRFVKETEAATSLTNCFLTEESCNITW